MDNRKCLYLSLFTDYDVYLFRKGKHYRLWKKFGSHITEVNSISGVYFAVWAPGAKSVEVSGEFNNWNSQGYELYVRWDKSGIWEGFIPGVELGHLYKYRIQSKLDNQWLEKSDPYAYRTEHPPQTASIVWDLNYQWMDEAWLKQRKKLNKFSTPVSIYEVHLASWMKSSSGTIMTYDELKENLVPYVVKMGFTHVEFMPVMEYPYAPSWGYQITGFFAASSRYGSPQGLMTLIDAFHQAGIGVILDWVPSHFPDDGHGLGYFDGTHVYEHPDPRKGYHQDWKSLIFNYERQEVISFLISNACFWLSKYHIDGLRVDAVASMLYLDYSREDGAWEPNEFGGNENLHAIKFIRNLNSEISNSFPQVLTIAEESTAYPKVTEAVDHEGLGFTMKWMMGWMHDTLAYFAQDPIHRSFHHGQITFSLIYAFSEKYVLPLSHDEVVHGKASLIYKMPGEELQKFANLRLLYTYMYTHPGAKLLFMGSEIAQTKEWDFANELSWELLQYELHQGIQNLVIELNRIYKTKPALFENDFDQKGFEWLKIDDYKQSVLIYLRSGKLSKDDLIVIGNFTPISRRDYQFNVKRSKSWQLVFNSDDERYGGSASVVKQELEVKKLKVNKEIKYQVTVDIPSLGMIIYEKK